MIDLLQAAPVPELSEEWIVSHQHSLVDALSQRRRKPLRWVGLAGATGVAATVLPIVLIGGSAQNAFAGWSASPTAPATGQLSAADSDCQARLAQAEQARPSNKVLPPTLVPVLSDVRGPYTVTVFGNGTQSGVLCVSAPNATGLRWIMGSGAPVGAGAIAVEQVSALARDTQPYTLVEGRTGDGVTGVTLSLGNGSKVTATTGNGVFVAWWPGSQSITSATVATSTGATTQTLNLSSPGNSTIPPTKSPPLSPGTESSFGSDDQSTVCLIHSCG